VPARNVTVTITTKIDQNRAGLVVISICFHSFFWLRRLFPNNQLSLVVRNNNFLDLAIVFYFVDW
jgi:hypothetical protein